ncbi:MAG: CooT family nickel-binding protein [Desulfobacteraceae bacterium]
MCEANAYFVKDNIEEKILESVDEVEVEDDTIRMVNIFGEQKILKARIRRYNSTEGKLLLESV